MTTLETLKAMRELLSAPERWTKGECARDASGNRVDISSPDATCFCLIGAAGLVGEFKSVMDLLDRLVAPGPASCWQDAPERTHAEVLALLDRAIEQESHAA